MSLHTGLRAVVVGGGIGGLATAVALHHTGWQVTVRERGQTLDRGGAGLVLWPNALRCLDVLGIADAVRSRATPLASTAIRRPDGRLLSRLAPDPRADRHPLGIVRADLIDALTAPLGPEVVRLGAAVTKADDVCADLVVGADGVRSTVRASLGSTVRPSYRGYTVWRALIPAAAATLTNRSGASETWGPGRRFGIVPAGPDATYVYAAAPAPEGQRSDDERAELQRRFGGWHAPIPAILNALDASTLLRHDIDDLPPGRTPLHFGRHVLVGDAGHAMEPNLGQGAGLALEDAVVLAHTLATAASVERALAAYSAARALRVAALSRQSRQIGRLAGLTQPTAVALRDLAMRATPSRVARRAAAGASNWCPPQSLPTVQENR